MIEDTRATRLDARVRLGFAQAGISVLRTLEQTDTKMRYAQFGRAIGLIGGEGWQPWHRQQVRDILALMAAAEKQAAGSGVPLQFARIVTGDGTPGLGVNKVSRVVTTSVAEGRSVD